MAQTDIPRITNDAGEKELFVTVKEFVCTGASAPFDHPHIYLDMGSDDEIICPYCSTRFRYQAA